MDKATTTYKGERLDLAALAPAGTGVAAATFEGCTIVGPGVVMMQPGSTLSGCTFEGDPEQVLWPLGRGMSAPVGAVSFLQCSFVGCTFQHISLAYLPKDEPEVRAGFGLPQR